MSAKMTLSNFLERLEGVYKSIDVRIVAAHAGDRWHNALTVVRFSHLEPNDIREQHKELEGKWGKIQTSGLVVEMEALAFDELRVLSNAFDLGHMFLPRTGGTSSGQRFTQFEKIDLLSLEGAFEHYGYTRREEHSWPCFEALTGSHCELLNNEQLQSEVKSYTLFDIYPLINELLEVNFHRNLSLDLIVNAPFYAMIKNVDFSEQRCQIQVKFHKDIKALAVSAIARTGDRDESPVKDKADSPIKAEDKETEELDQHFRLWTKELDLLNAAPADYLWLSLIQTEPTALDIEKPSFPTQIKRFLESKKPAKAPLVGAFSRFCSLHGLEEYLTKPAQTKPFKAGRRDASATFELAVAWLLGLCGFNLVWLGQTMHEVLKENNVSRFSMDILASHHQSENLLLLIGCTIGSPNDKDIDGLKSIRRVLQDDIFKDTKLHIKPLIFSAAPELANKDRDGVKVLDADDIRGILNLLRQGEIKRALNQGFGHELGFIL